MKDVKVVKLNINPEEVDDFKKKLEELLAENKPEILPICPCDECDGCDCDDDFDDEAFDDYDEGFIEGTLAGINMAAFLARMPIDVRMDVFNTSRLADILSNWNDDVMDALDAYMTEHRFHKGDVVYEVGKFGRYLVVEDDLDEEITVLDSDFKEKKLFRWNLKKV